MRYVRPLIRRISQRVSTRGHGYLISPLPPVLILLVVFLCIRQVAGTSAFLYAALLVLGRGVHVGKGVLLCLMTLFNPLNPA